MAGKRLSLGVRGTKREALLGGGKISGSCLHVSYGLGLAKSLGTFKMVRLGVRV